MYSVKGNIQLYLPWYPHKMVPSKRCASMIKNRYFWVKKKTICAGSRINQKPYTGQITEIAPYVRTYLWGTIQYKYHDTHVKI